jgi:pyridoxamine 5'-phosphate oxidase
MDGMSDPAGMRRAYLRGALDESVVSASWREQFRLWFDAAAADPSVLEPTAMQLATAGPDGHPAVRTVLMKGLDERGIAFFTNYESAKAAELAANAHAAAVFVWLAHERQVRFTGAVTKVSADETAAYFASRPRGSQIGAWASPQSRVVRSRADLDALVAEAEARFDGQEVPVPPHWGGYRLVPTSVEFWQGRADRLHDRLRYRLSGEEWVLERLAP